MMDDQRIITTSEGVAKLQAELKQLKDEDRPAILQRIKDAKELGDLSENADYSDAKDQQAFIEGRIMELETTLKNVEVAGPRSGAAAAIGSTVVVVGPSGEKTIRIVGATEANPSTGDISHESPLGRALFGSHVGDKVTVDAPSGPVAYTVKAVS